MKEVPLGVLFDKDHTLIDAKNIWNPFYYYIISTIAKNFSLDIQKIATDSKFDLVNKVASDSSILWNGSPKEIITNWSKSSGIKECIIQSIVEDGYSKLNYNVPIIKELKSVITKISKIIPNLGIATMDNARSARKTTKALGIDEQIKFYYGTDEGLRKKPEPDMIFAFAKDLKVPVKTILMVGDSPRDMAMAKTAGSSAIGVLTGGSTKSKLKESGAMEIIPDISYLPKLLS
jgi:phosphoglycolate phosphatase